MTPKIFSASLFYGFIDIQIHPELAQKIASRVAERAQEVHDKWLADQPVVYGNPDKTTKEVYSWWVDSRLNREGSRFTARLVAIEEIKKEPCRDHVATVMSSQVAERNPVMAFALGAGVVCQKCGVKLKAKWEEA